MPYFEFSSNQTSNNSTSSEEPNFELSMVFTVLSFLCILFVVLVLVLASCITTRPIRMKELFKKRHFITGTFSFACLVSVFQMLSYHTTAEKLINSITRILIEVLGTVLMFTGTSFFVLPADDGSHRGSRLNHKDPYFGAFILCMAFLMMPFAALIGVGACLEPNRDFMYLCGTIASIIQKMTQSVFYYSDLQHKVPLNGRRTEAAWFLRALSLFNFLLWLNDLLNLSSSNDRHLEKVLGGGLYTTASVTYDSIVVEYRLLFSMLFLEQSLEIVPDDGDTDEEEELVGDDDVGRKTDHQLVQRQNRTDADSLRLKAYRTWSLAFGVFVIFSQFGNIAEYTLNAGWSNIIAIITDLLLILLGALVFKEVSLLWFYFFQCTFIKNLKHLKKLLSLL